MRACSKAQKKRASILRRSQPGSMGGFSTLLAGQQFATDAVLQYSEALTRLSSDPASYRNIETDITDAAIASCHTGSYDA